MINRLTQDPKKPILEIIKELEKSCPLFLSGLISHPEYDLVTWIEEEQNALFFGKPKIEQDEVGFGIPQCTIL